MIMATVAIVEHEQRTASAVPSRLLSSRFAKWRGPLLAFLVGQPAVQFLNLLTGFFLIRWLDVEQFAMFGIAFAFQSAITQLTDLGFSGSIIALAGGRGHDPDVLGAYLKSAAHWRSRIQGFTLLLAWITFPLVVWSLPWNTVVKGLLLFSITLGVLFQQWAMYGAPLLIHRALRKYYAPQIFGAVARLSLCTLLHFAGLLNAWIASLIAALVVAYTGISYRRSSRGYIREPAQTQADCNAEMLRYLSPFIPGVVFMALQGQILVGIIAFFGSTQNIAEVSALGRIGQIFLILGAFNSVFVEPYIARVPVSLLPSRYSQILAAAVILATVLAAMGFLLPEPLLWLLGRNYAGLDREIGWVVLASSINYIGGVMWAMHAARKWIFWWGTAVYIFTMVFIQTLCIILLDLSQTLSVVWFGVITSCALLLVHATTAVYGFTRIQKVKRTDYEK